MAEAATQLAEPALALKDREGKYLTFALDREEFGLEILKVREIIGLMEVTPVPQTPDFIKGVINLRGRVIPVIDLRLKFGLPAKPPDERTCIIVTEVRSGAGALQIGVVVDAVSEVLNIAGEDIEPPPSFGSRVDTRYILGIAKSRDNIKILLDLDLALSGDEMSGLGQF